MKIILPIHYEQKFKTKKSKTFLVGLNWYRNAHHRISNVVKIHYHELVAEQVKDKKFKKIRLEYDVYVARNGTDGHNIRSVIEKFFLDGLVDHGSIPDDNTQEYVMRDSTRYFIDKQNPRIEINIIEVK
jgi:hypothetical protein